MLTVYLAKSYEDALSIIENHKDKKWVAIETEYGEETLGVSSHPSIIKSCNHHGKLQENEAPSLSCIQESERYDNFIISHIDIDILFGILWCTGWLKKTNTTLTLAKLIAEADVNGFHTIKESLKKIDKRIVQKYFAIGYLINSWVFKDNGKDIVDISKEVHKLLLKIKDIIVEEVNEEQIALYEKWFQEQKKIVKNHLIDILTICEDKYLFIFSAPFSLTTAYELDENHTADIIVQYNEQTRSITLSCYNDEVAEKYFGKNGVITPLQKFFGNAAGGKKAVGGSPRNIKLQPEVLNAFVEFIRREYINAPEVIHLVEN